MSPGARVHQFVVTADEAGVRLDVLVVRHVAALGRRAVRTLFEQGAVLADGRVAKKGQLSRSGAEVTVHLGPADVALPEPGAPLTVLLETAQMLVVDKPAGQPTAVGRSDRRAAPANETVQPGSGGTLVNALLGRYPELHGIGYGPREPGIIHRLDTQTSGLVIAARTAEAFERLTRALKSDALDKRYLAVVERFGLPAEGWIDEPLAPHPRRSDRVVVARDRVRGRPATTHFRRVQTPDSAGRWALLELCVDRAQRHQIRVHLAHLGHPIAGDRLYGGPPAPELGERHALHASYVAWAGDDRIDAFAVEAPLPAEMAGLVGR